VQALGTQGQSGGYIHWQAKWEADNRRRCFEPTRAIQDFLDGGRRASHQTAPNRLVSTDPTPSYRKRSRHSINFGTKVARKNILQSAVPDILASFFFPVEERANKTHSAGRRCAMKPHADVCN
jgi:hypothetical protein